MSFSRLRKNDSLEPLQLWSCLRLKIILDFNFKMYINLYNFFTECFGWWRRRFTHYSWICRRRTSCSFLIKPKNLTKISQEILVSQIWKRISAWRLLILKFFWVVTCQFTFTLLAENKENRYLTIMKPGSIVIVPRTEFQPRYQIYVTSFIGTENWEHWILRVLSPVAWNSSFSKDS